MKDYMKDYLKNNRTFVNKNTMKTTIKLTRAIASAITSAVTYVAAFAGILLVSLLISCTPEDNQQGSLNIPERYWGNYTGVNTRFKATIEAHKITVVTPNKTYVRTEGTTISDNGSSLFQANLLGEEKLALAKDAYYVGINIYTPQNGWVFAADYYFKN